MVTMTLSAASATLLALMLLSTSAASAGGRMPSRSRAVVGEDGGYSGVTVRISDDVPEEDCADIIQNLKVGPTSAAAEAVRTYPNSLVLERLQTTHAAWSLLWNR